MDNSEKKTYMVAHGGMSVATGAVVVELGVLYESE